MDGMTENRKKRKEKKKCGKEERPSYIKISSIVICKTSSISDYLEQKNSFS